MTTTTTPSPDLPPPQDAAAKKRQRILDAAASCFAGHGFVKTTVEEIATAAGVSKGLVYVHFDGKEALLEAVLEATLQEWRLVIDEHMASTRDAAEALAVMHRRSLEFALSHPLLQRILDRDSRLILAHVDGPARRATEEWRAQVRDLLSSGIAAGNLRDDLDVDRTADVFLVFHSAFLGQIVEPDLAQINADLITTSVDVLLQGLAAPANS